MSAYPLPPLDEIHNPFVSAKQIEAETYRHMINVAS